MRATPSSRFLAASMSASVGAVRTAIRANSEDFFQDLADRGQRIELAPGHLVEEAAELRVVRDGLLEVLFRARARDGEDLAGEVARTPIGQQPRLLEVTAVPLDLLPKLP